MKRATGDTRAGGPGPRSRAAAAALALALVLGIAVVEVPRGGPAPSDPSLLADGLLDDLFLADADSALTLDAVAARLSACAQASPDVSDGSCVGILYLWSSRMPLSQEGIAEIRSAAESLSLELQVLESGELVGASARGGAAESLAREMISAGATLHEPALLVYRSGRLLGSAILGYKTAEAYASLVHERLADESPASVPHHTNAPALADVSVALEASFKDYQVPGQPGAYFRWVPGRNAVAYEAGGRIYLLDLESGERTVGPGNVDFVPTPDGRFFVTPGRSRELEFYDAGEVFTAARAGRGAAVPPIYSDPEMRDQYPSVGILSTTTQGSSTRTVYRVLTSWFDKVVFRDYEVRSEGGGPAVRPLGAPVVACGGYRFSIPIMSQNGREVAGRDEASATTKVFRLADDGGCQEALDLELPTGKVAWDPDGRRIAFAIPEGAVRDGAGVLWNGGRDPERAGVFVHDRRGGTLTKVEGSQEARRLTFPEFVGRDQLLFLLPPETPAGASRFRLVCCLR